ncbi:MAG: hypothetical protein ACE5JG_13005 [Planctomycetota bacterium]
MSLPGWVSLGFTVYAALFGVSWAFGSWVEGWLVTGAGPAASLAAVGLVVWGLWRRRRRRGGGWIWCAGLALFAAFVAGSFRLLPEQRWYVQDTLESAAETWLYLAGTAVVGRLLFALYRAWRSFEPGKRPRPRKKKG